MAMAMGLADSLNICLDVKFVMHTNVIGRQDDCRSSIPVAYYKIWSTVKSVCLHVVCDCFQALTVELISCKKDHMAEKVYNIYYLALEIVCLFLASVLI